MRESKASILLAPRACAGVRAVHQYSTIDVVRFAGQEVAAVAAISTDIANDAIELIKVDYEPLSFVADLDRCDGRRIRAAVFENGSNLGKPVDSQCWRSVASVFASGGHDEATYTTPVQTHVCLRFTGASRVGKATS